MTIDAPVLSSAPTGRIWIQSDLQLADPALAKQVLKDAVDDMLSLELDLCAAWCLGDALCGNKLAALEEVARMTIEQFDRLNVPVCYVMGNHEMDLIRGGCKRHPLYELACAHPQWHTMAAIDQLYFARQFCGTTVIFMGDHMALDGSWWTSHGQLHGDKDGYPHTLTQYHALRDAMGNLPGPAMTASHYAYPGGQRPSVNLEPLLPLPGAIRLHVYGHAHIGDMVWNKEKPYQRLNPITGQSLPSQFNISALETVRSSGSHSAILDMGPAGPEKLRIRCHQSRSWLESFDL